MRTPDARSGAGGWTLPGYTEERELGRGDSGRVVAAVEKATGRRVAIKYLSPALAEDHAFMDRFRAEAQQLTRVDVPSAVRVYDFAEQPGAGAAVVMELVSGITLAALIERRGPLSPEAALTVLKGILLALAAVHRLGFGHGDCKPGNVLVDEAGQVKLTDFGLARPAGDEFPAAGTPRYLAPEVWRGEPATSAADVYAATAVFYECLAGHPPFDGDLNRLREQHAGGAVPLDGIDEPLRPFIADGMAPERGRRPHSANAFVSELEAMTPAMFGAGWEERGRGQLAAAVPAAAGRGPRVVSVGRSSEAASGVRQPGRRRLLAAAAAAAAIVIAGAVAAVTLSGSHHQAPLSGSPSPSGAAPGAASRSGTAALAATAAVSPVSRSLTSCAAGVPAFVFTAAITDSRAGRVAYHWQLPSGSSPPRTLRFAAPGTKTVSTSYRPGRGSGSGSGTLVVTSPAAATSNAAAFTLACGQLLSVTSDAPASAQVGAGYAGTVTVSGGSGGYTWEVTGLPPGLTASPGGPALTVSGSPQTAGTFTAQVTVHDTARPHDAGTARLTLTVADAPVQVSGGLGTAIAGEPYSASLSATGGNGGFRWGRVSGLPAGMTATPRGDTLVIAGTPAVTGDFPVTVSVSDTGSPAQTGTGRLILVIDAPAPQATAAPQRGAPPGQPAPSPS
jgi:eukaryotic-like serine/threonine-protein kinase